MNPQTKYKLQEVLFIVIYWIAASNLYILIRYVGSDTNPGSGAIEETIHVKNLVMPAIIGGFFVGGLTGLLEIFVYPIFLRKKSFGAGIFFRTLIFLFIVVLAIAVISFAFYMRRNLSITETFELTVGFYKSVSFLSLFIYLLVISSIMDFILQVNKKFGPGIIFNTLQGKYHHPREEERIFMFLDLHSSSKIAEELGHIDFSYFLQDCFRDLSEVLLKYQASVYQFVGDEAVLTWYAKNGLKNANCIKIFYAFDEILQAKHNYYHSKYGHTPLFKAAINIGKVTVAEVGVIKSEIAYHGDVLNTGARVQGLCNLYNEKLLITQELADSLQDQTAVNIQFLDEVDLRGKENKEQIYKVKLN